MMCDGVRMEDMDGEGGGVCVVERGVYLQSRTFPSQRISPPLLLHLHSLPPLSFSSTPLLRVVPPLMDGDSLTGWRG